MRRLYFSNGSPLARKVRIVLHEKGLDYERDIDDRVRPVEDIGSLEPNLAVPVLVDGGLTLFESNLILAYLLETYPRTRRTLRPDGVTPETSAYMARQAARVQRCLDWLEARATPEGFAPGWFSAMDTAFICPVAFGEKRGVLEWRGRPRLEALYDRLQARPSVAATPVNDWPPKG